MPAPYNNPPRRDDRGPNQGGNQYAQAANVTADFRDDWITKQIDMSAIEFADKFGESLKIHKFTASQIRNFFGEVRRIQQKGVIENRTAFILLLPKLAYAAARAENSGAKQFETVFKRAIMAVNIDDADAAEIVRRFQNFCDFFEAVLAYHKKHGGKNN